MIYIYKIFCKEEGELCPKQERALNSSVSAFNNWACYKQNDSFENLSRLSDIKSMFSNAVARHVFSKFLIFFYLKLVFLYIILKINLKK